MHRRVFVLCSLLACGSPAVIDAGVPDAGVPDAGTTMDSGVDAGAVDAGHDAGVVEDAGVIEDAGVVEDAGVIEDAGVDAGPDDAGVVIADAGPTHDDAGCRRPSGLGAAFPLRVMAANLTSGNFQSYDPGHGIRIIQGLRPDVVMLQEMNYGANTPAAMDTFMNVLDAGYRYTRGAGQIPNGILSRYPIADAGEWPDPRVGNRGFTWAIVDLPGPRELFVVSVHLLTSSATERNLEAVALLSQLSANVPPGDFLLVGGDFNTEVFSEAALTTLASRVTTGAPPPSDQAGNPHTNANRTKPYDQVLVSSCLEREQLDAGLVFDSRVYTPLSEVAPVQIGDSAAPSMQHMAVVKDFVIQP